MYNKQKKPSFDKTKFALLIGAIILIIVYGLSPNKEYFACKNKWNGIPDNITVTVSSYLFGMKHSINHFNILECRTTEHEIFCNSAETSSITIFNRINADFDTATGINIQQFSCKKTDKQI